MVSCIVFMTGPVPNETWPLSLGFKAKAVAHELNECDIFHERRLSTAVDTSTAKVRSCELAKVTILRRSAMIEDFQENALSWICRK